MAADAPVCATCELLGKAVLVAACQRLKRDDCKVLGETLTMKELAERIIAEINKHPDTPESKAAAGVLERFIDVYQTGGVEGGR